MRGLDLLAAALLAMAGHAVAGDDVVARSGEILAEQRAIRADMDALKGRYADMPLVKREKIAANQDRLFALLEGTVDTSELDPADRTEAFNLQQAIAAAINDREDERIVCERIKRTGSHRVTRVCKSVAQMRAEREAARASMENQPRNCMAAACLSD